MNYCDQVKQGDPGRIGRGPRWAFLESGSSAWCLLEIHLSGGTRAPPRGLRGSAVPLPCSGFLRGGLSALQGAAQALANRTGKGRSVWEPGRVAFLQDAMKSPRPHSSPGVTVHGAAHPSR